MKKVASLLKVWIVLIGLTVTISAMAQDIEYSTSFDETGFSSGTRYDLQNELPYGPYGKRWGISYGTISESGALEGKKSLVCRYRSSCTADPYACTTFPVENVKRIEFLAKVTSKNIYLTLQYSSDAGNTWIDANNFDIDTKATVYTYTFPESLHSVYFRFLIKHKASSTNAQDFLLDNVIIYSSTTDQPDQPDQPETLQHYTRTGLHNGQFGTIALGHNVTDLVDSGATFYKILKADKDNKDDLVSLTLSKVNSLDADKAYIFIAHESEITLDYYDNDHIVNVTNGPLVGNLGSTPIDVPKDCYVLYNNQLRKIYSDGSATVGQNRAYINPDYIETTYNSNNEDNIILMVYDPTAITQPKADEQTQVSYDLLGRKATHNKYHLFIKNGRKYIEQR